MAKLHQILAIEKGAKKAYEASLRSTRNALAGHDDYSISNRHLNKSRGDPFTGHTRTYEPVDAEGGQLPEESRTVRTIVKALLFTFLTKWTNYITAVTRRDEANATARGDITIDGQVLKRGVLTTTLLKIEKDCDSQIQAVFDTLPTLDAGQTWKYDENFGLYVSEPVKNNRTVNEQVPVVLYPPTEKHPAQTQLVNKAIHKGTFTTINYSGKYPVDEKNKQIERLTKLKIACSVAREGANDAKAPESDLGQRIYDFLTTGTIKPEE